MKKQPSPNTKAPKSKEEPSPYASPATDPQGSYTGVCADPKEIPTQDADDL